MQRMVAVASKLVAEVRHRRLLPWATVWLWAVSCSGSGDPPVPRLQAAQVAAGQVICANYGDGWKDPLNLHCTACVQQADGTWLAQQGCFSVDGTGTRQQLTPCSEVIGPGDTLTVAGANGDPSAFHTCVADPFYASDPPPARVQPKPSSGTPPAAVANPPAFTPLYGGLGDASGDFQDPAKKGVLSFDQMVGLVNDVDAKGQQRPTVRAVVRYAHQMLTTLIAKAQAAQDSIQKRVDYGINPELPHQVGDLQTIINLLQEVISASPLPTANPGQLPPAVPLKSFMSAYALGMEPLVARSLELGLQVVIDNPHSTVTGLTEMDSGLALIKLLCTPDPNDPNQLPLIAGNYWHTLEKLRVWPAWTGMVSQLDGLLTETEIDNVYADAALQSCLRASKVATIVGMALQVTGIGAPAGSALVIGGTSFQTLVQGTQLFNKIADGSATDAEYFQFVVNLGAQAAGGANLDPKTIGWLAVAGGAYGTGYAAHALAASNPNDPDYLDKLLDLIQAGMATGIGAKGVHGDPNAPGPGAQDLIPTEPRYYQNSQPRWRNVKVTQWVDQPGGTPKTATYEVFNDATQQWDTWTLNRISDTQVLQTDPAGNATIHDFAAKTNTPKAGPSAGKAESSIGLGGIKMLPPGAKPPTRYLPKVPAPLALPRDFTANPSLAGGPRGRTARPRS